MTRAKRPILSLLISILGFVGLGLVVWKVPPQNLLVELGVLALLVITLILSLSWLIGSAKIGTRIAIGIMGLLVMSRFGFLNGITLGLWILAFGLLSLVN